MKTAWWIGLVAVVGLSACGSDGDGDGREELGRSRSNPAPIGTTLRDEFDSFGGTFEADVTVLEVVRGEEAFRRLREASHLNGPPTAGHEWVLARIRFHLLRGPTSDARFDLGYHHFSAVTSDGRVYGQHPFVVPPEPLILAELFPGASHEGWNADQVLIGDRSLLLFGEESDGSGGAWWELYE